MRNRFNRFCLFITLLVGLCASSFAVEENFYKWTDEKGIIHYGDHVPPEYSQQEQSELNKFGLTVGVTNAPKTKEQLIEDERKARVQAAERRKIAEMRLRDQALLNSYTTVKDLENTRDAKIAAVDSIITATNSNIAISLKTLRDLMARAAEIDGSGKPVPEVLRKNISSTQDLIGKYKAYIETKRKEQHDIRTQLDDDIKRFRELRGLPETEISDQEILSQKNGDLAKDAAKKEGRMVMAECNDPPGCAQAWSLAQYYIEAKSSARLQIVTDTHLATAEPSMPDSIGLSVVRVPIRGGERFVMEIHCHNSPEGKEFCRTPEAQSILDGFKDYLSGH